MCVFAGMDLFEEAVRRWEEALTFRSGPSEDDASCVSVKAGDAIAEQRVEVKTAFKFVDLFSVGCGYVTVMQHQFNTFSAQLTDLKIMEFSIKCFLITSSWLMQTILPIHKLSI